MKQKSYRVLGVMSGTSLDGIDLAIISLVPPEASEAGQWHYQFHQTQTHPYPARWKNILKEAVHFSEGRLRQLNSEYTRFLAEFILTHISKATLESLDAVCSHGHTVLHQPDQGVTLQIGNLPELATLLNTLVVCDFRTADVQLGGQGAPLVPIGDQLLFSQYDYCLNLGGFANLSYDRNGKRIAYDICPVNIVLNQYAEKLNQPYDAYGSLAASGKIVTSLLTKLNALPYYEQNPPKSLGVEWVQSKLSPILENAAVAPNDILRTMVAHIAVQIGSEVTADSKVLVTGGGAYNDFLISQLKQHTKATIEVPDNQLVEFKEALVFGLLGVLRLRDEVNCLASVTGAPKDHSAGCVYSPKNNGNLI